VARDLSHESPDVRAAAAEALGLLGTSPPPEALDALRGDYYRQVRQSAEAALARIAKAPEGRAAK
jgi:HEAT repeat protein